jgi:hypothetical protein
MTRSYQEAIAVNTLYEIRLKSLSGLGETLKPRITAIGTAATITLYGAENAPTGLTQANIAEKMALISDGFQIGFFESLPNFIAIIPSGTIDELVLTGCDLVSTTAIPAS